MTVARVAGADTTFRVAIRVSGTVQGVGFRPFVYALAHRLGVSGFVGNDPQGVFIEAQASDEVITDFVARLADEAPALAHITSVDVRPCPPHDDSSAFRIARSRPGPATGAEIPPDIAVCAECLAEMRDPSNRRHRYPFIACTHCGPRFTIASGLPYDREHTTYAGFPLCAACRAEYEDPRSRRFHAQPTACAECGPRLSMPVRDVVAALRNGWIVAIKGIGGYHLACDAGDDDVVARLRRRKRRGGKPFAIMVRDEGTAARLVDLDETARALLTSPARPAVVLPATDQAAAISERVAPAIGALAVMLPYSPLHHLLFDSGAPDVLVMTSGNLSDEPICVEADEAESRLAAVADVFCHHDRPIHIACDDSVVAVSGGTVTGVRRSRGYAPEPLRLPFETPPMLAVGGELKSTLCLARGDHAWLSQHVGDTGNLETLTMMRRTAARMCAFQRLSPEVVVSDAHPGYASRRWAAAEAARRGALHVTVQHHHAHMAALMAENEMPADAEIVGIVCDGTGFGTDGTVWGGEILAGGYRHVQRLGHLRPTVLPGGDAAIAHPARTALAHMWTAGVAWEDTAPRDAVGDRDAALLARMFTSGSHCVSTTSVGRLFDAVASILAVRQAVDFEGQAAMELEALARRAVRSQTGGVASSFDSAGVSVAAVTEDRHGSAVIDPTPLLRHAIDGYRRGDPVDRLALDFHRGLATGLAGAAIHVAAKVDLDTVGLSGGVFANAILTAECSRLLKAAGLNVLTHTLVPPNDGGLALGQVAVVAAGGGSRADHV